MKPALIIYIMLFRNNLLNGCGQAVTGVNVNFIVMIICHARGSSHERDTQDGLRFCTLCEYYPVETVCSRYPHV